MGRRLIRWAFAAIILLSIVSLFAVQITSFSGQRFIRRHYSAPFGRLMAAHFQKHYLQKLSRPHDNSKPTSPINLSTPLVPAHLQYSLQNDENLSNTSTQVLITSVHANKIAGGSKQTQVNRNSIGATSRFEAQNCRDQLCSEYVNTSVDTSFFKHCISLARHKYKLYKLYDQKKYNIVDWQLLPNGRCRFINGTGRGSTGLVSFPGSGNTWVRGLLEQATGVCTGSVYCDYSLRLSGFNGEAIRSGAVLVVKTHTELPRWTTVPHTVEIAEKGSRTSFDAVIYLVRNPRDAMVSEWNRRMSIRKKLVARNGTAHTQALQQDMFGNNTDWDEFVHSWALRWMNMFQWVTQGSPQHPVLVVKYEDLKRDAVATVARMLDFLDFPYTVAALKRTLQDGFNTFKRASHPEFEHFTPFQKQRLTAVTNSAYVTLREKLQDSCGLEEYLD